MDDLISRQAVKELAHNQMREKYCGMALKKQRDFYIKLADSIIDLLPSAQPEIKPIEYLDCANAMLEMWMDNVVTDGEYNRIMDKLNAHWGMKNG